MPRGRHRHSPALHRLLPPATVAASSVAAASGAWVVGETVVIRGLAAAAAAAAVFGAVLMRRWDRSAGKRVAQLTAARTREEWKAEERIAELETELEEARAVRAKVELKLRGKRAELARLRTEHADLLRRYAAAETGRASALESRRQARGAKSAAAADRTAEETALPVTASAFRAAADALRDLERKAAERPVTTAKVPEPAKAPESVKLPESAKAPESVKLPEPAKAPESVKVPAPGKWVRVAEVPRAAGPVELDEVAVSAEPVKAAGSVNAAETAKSAGTVNSGEAVKPTEAVASAQAPVPVRAAAAVVPPQARPAPRTQGGFDFFGTQRPSAAGRPVEETDLADVVGEEALAEADADAGAEAAASAGEDIIDLTEHDETEQIDVADLRSAIS
ncbi:hypothetical protein [Streptomyces sp. UNOC14_S4]|uniref:hypothetical protein n=1 Tax=Streptomyces sp. UNOC14_S4 TaxID=2872340 RepID=UPI001E3DAEC9|nr:hypothetical protein [Streptomyces sp. UNOC14_S4]MCC3770453.1 hypothetical protein [Streptomyces sp. UNOC14_S4]